MKKEGFDSNEHAVFSADAFGDNRGKRDAVDVQVGIRTDTPVPTLELLRMHLAVLAVIGAGVVIGLGFLLRDKGVLLKKGVTDPVGSSANAEKWVERFQTANGYLLGLVEEVSETYFEALMAAYVTFLVNRRWSKRDTKTAVSRATRYKELLITWMPPIVLYMINVSFTSLFVDHTIDHVKRAIARQDLMYSAVSGINKSQVGIEDTIMHGVISKRVEPFQLPLNAKCSVVMDDVVRNVSLVDDIPSLQEIGATSVVYGFQSRDWNYDAIPAALEPKASVKVQIADVANGSNKAFEDFRAKSGFTINTGYELLYQGTLLLERALADTTDALWPCDPEKLEELLQQMEIENANAMDETDGNGGQRRLQAAATVPVYVDETGALYYVKDGNVYSADGEMMAVFTPDLPIAPLEGNFNLTLDAATKQLVDADGVPVTSIDGRSEDDSEANSVAPEDQICRGGPTMLGQLAGFHHVDNQTIKQLLLRTHDVLDFNFGPSALSLDDMVVKLNHIHLGDFVNVTAMTIDIPFDANISYHDPDRDCLTEEQQAVCKISNTTYPFAMPELMCNAETCIFLDRAKAPKPRKELQMMPYMRNFTSKLEFDENLFLMLPSNQSVTDDAAFLYGYGSYINGDELVRMDGDKTIPYIKNPRRHLVITFAKLHWQFQSLDKVFNARCSDRLGCDGLTFKLHSVRESNESNSAFQSFKDHDKGKTYNFLLIHKSTIQEDIRRHNQQNPAQLAAIMSTELLYPADGNSYPWEYINPARFPGRQRAFAPLGSKSCSLEVEAYLQQLQVNRYVLEEPLYPLYTSAIYYLFQHAALKQAQEVTAKTKTKNDKVVGYGGGRFNVQLDLNANRERKVIRFKVSGISAITTLIGVACMWIVTAAVLLKPLRRYRHEPARKLAEHYVAVINEESYPPAVHRGKLLLPTKEEVSLEDFEVERITLHERGNVANQFDLLDES